MKRIQLFFVEKVIPKKNKKSPGITKTGRLFTYTAGKAGASEEALQKEAWLQCVRIGHKSEASKRVHAEFVFKKTTADLIGVTETMQDALQGVCYDDDKQITSQAMRWDDGEVPFLPKGHTAYVELTFKD